MMSEHVELNEETRARLEKYVEERGAFPFHLTCETHDDLIENLLDDIERLEHKCERIEEQADLDREVLFDACLVGMQRAKTEDFDIGVSTLKKELLENIRLGSIWTGNNALLPLRNDGSREWYKQIICDRAKEHNKTRRYDNPIFKKFDKWRR